MKLIWLPGYAFLFFYYLLPLEWGKKRNVARSARWWQQRHVLAPWISAAFYILCTFALMTVLMSFIFSNSESGQNAQVQVQAAPVITPGRATLPVPGPAAPNGAREPNMVGAGKSVANSDLSIALPKEPATPILEKSDAALPPKPAAPMLEKSDAAEEATRYEALVIEREIKSHYSGDDKMVRCRWDLPAKKLEGDQRGEWRAMLEKAKGEENIAFTWMLERYCSR